MLNIEQPDQLLAYLRQHNHIAAGEEVTITPLAGGVSNRTVLVEWPSGEAWVIKQALEKLRVAVDPLRSPQRIHREAAQIGRSTVKRELPLLNSHVQRRWFAFARMLGYAYTHLRGQEKYFANISC